MLETHLLLLDLYDVHMYLGRPGRSEAESRLTLITTQTLWITRLPPSTFAYLPLHSPTSLHTHLPPSTLAYLPPHSPTSLHTRLPPSTASGRVAERSRWLTHHRRRRLSSSASPLAGKYYKPAFVTCKPLRASVFCSENCL